MMQPAENRRRAVVLKKLGPVGEHYDGGRTWTQDLPIMTDIVPICRAHARRQRFKK
jgi:hypothetical protein